MKKDKKPENKKKNRTIYYDILIDRKRFFPYSIPNEKVGFLMALTVKPIKLNKSKTILNC